MAQLPSVGQEQFYSILAANDDMVFMHVDEPGGKCLAVALPRVHGDVTSEPYFEQLSFLHVSFSSYP